MPSKHLYNGVKKRRKDKVRNTISLETKLIILSRFDRGEKLTHIAKQMGLATSTVSTIYNNRDRIRAQYGVAAPKSVSRISRDRGELIEQTENFLLVWIDDNKHHNIPSTSKMIREKALSIYDALNYFHEGPKMEPFKASKGWLEKFKVRHNLHNLAPKELTPAESEAALAYPEYLRSIIEDGGYLPQQVFNIEETRLFWKRMPKSTYLSRVGKSSSGRRALKERITLLLGANASGDFKLKPMVIYSNENRRAFKGVDKSELPVIWKTHKRGWMSKTIFREWIQDHFVPEVEAYLERKKLSKKVLLLTETGPRFPVSLQKVSSKVKIEYLRKNNVSPMRTIDQGGIAAFKLYYLRKTFRLLIDSTERGNRSSVKLFWKKLNIKCVLENIYESWKEVKKRSMSRIWRNIWPQLANVNRHVSVTEVYEDILKMGSELGFKNLTEMDIVHLLNSHREEPSDDMNKKAKPEWPGELALEKLAEALNCIENGVRILIEHDPNCDRSSNISRRIDKTIFCYKRLEIRLTKQALMEADPNFRPGSMCTEPS